MKQLVPSLLSAVAILAGCSPSETSTATLPAPAFEILEASPTPEPSATPFTLVLSDALGRSVEIVGAPQRVISLSAPITSSFFTSGLQELLVGRDSSSIHPEEAETIPSLGDRFAEFDPALFLPLEADLILADTNYPLESVLAIEALGLPVFVLPLATSLDDIYANLSLIGTLTDKQEAVDQSIAALSERMRAVEMALQDVDSRPAVFYELEASDPTAPWTYGAGTILDEMLALAGGENVAASLAGTWVQLPLSELQAADPAYILLADAAYGVSLESLQSRPGWDTLEAVQQGQVLPFDESIISLPGPRIIDAIEDLAALLHPDRYP